MAFKDKYLRRDHSTLAEGEADGDLDVRVQRTNPDGPDPCTNDVLPKPAS